MRHVAGLTIAPAFYILMAVDRKGGPDAMPSVLDAIVLTFLMSSTLRVYCGGSSVRDAAFFPAGDAPITPALAAWAAWPTGSGRVARQASNQVRVMAGATR